ncbi:MAG: hypothetical protein H7Z72_09230 [Bacteroidetes bacterium]|nr:hypothetical protein [Fibrella sp.]
MTTIQPDPDEVPSANDTDTAPDSDTQSSAASAQGDRTDVTEGANNAPNDPAEGAETPAGFFCVVHLSRRYRFLETDTAWMPKGRQLMIDGLSGMM